MTFTDASHYTVQDITMENTGTTWAGVILSEGNSEDINIDNCHIITPLTTSSSTWNANRRAVLALNAGISDWSVTNCTIEGGSHGIYVYTSWSAASGEDVEILNNTILDSYYQGLYISKMDQSKVNNNAIISNSSYSWGYALYVSSCVETEVNGNYIAGGTSWPSYGIYLSSVSGDLNTFAPVYNNRVYMPSNAGNYGIYVSNTLFSDFAHNSVYYNGGSNSEGVYFSSGQYAKFRNNNIQMGGSGVALYANSNVLYESDYNNLSAPNGNIGYSGSVQATLADWQTATGFDSNSITVNEVYSDTMTLKVCTDSLYQMGVMMPEVMVDYEGETRMDPPCIGADEFMPISEFGFTASPVLCDGDTLSLEVLYFDSVVWNQTVTSPTFDVTGAGPVEVAVYDGCGTDTSNFVVTGQDYADLGALNLCEGDTIQMSSGIPNGTYMWSTGESTEMVDVYMEGPLAVEVMDEHGCYSEDSIMVTRSIPASLPDTAYFCEGGDVALDCGTTGSYAWSDGASSAINNVDVAGPVCVTVTDANCTSSACSEVIEILEPVPAFTDSSDHNTVVFTNTSTNTNANTTYFWDFGDGNTSTDENPIHVYGYTADSAVTTEVTLEVTNDCGTYIYTAFVNHGTEVSVNEIAIADMISLFPNPSNGTFNVAINAATSTDVNVEVLDVRGAQILVQNLGKVNGQMTQEINLEGAAAGIYFVKVNFNEQTAIYKLSVK